MAAKRTTTRRKGPAEPPEETPARVFKAPPPRFSLATIERHQDRVRRLCLALPEAAERLSHGEPTFFVGKVVGGHVFAQMSTDHHDDGHLAVVIPLAEGVQESLIERDPTKYYVPPYVGVRGWIGIELPKVSDRLLKQHLREAWRLVAPKWLLKIAGLV